MNILTRPHIFRSRVRSSQGFTLAEVVICIAITALIFGGIINSYIESAFRAERAGYSMAAEGLALQALEQARAAKWDTQIYPIVDEVTNIPKVMAVRMDLPQAGTNQVWATNYVTVSTVTVASNPNVQLHMVKASTVWPITRLGKRVWYTNTVANYFAPDR